MANEMVVLQGKEFTTGLQSMLGSTAYGWCLTGLPKGIALLHIENEPTASGVSPIIQRFYFVAYAKTEKKAEIEFTLVNFATKVPSDQKHVLAVTVVPSDSEEFAKYSENEDAMLRSNAAIPYGYVCGTQDTTLKYGYPCDVQDAVLK